jgi:sporulation protein YlmC with PRC-barrel domain
LNKVQPGSKLVLEVTGKEAAIISDLLFDIDQKSLSRIIWRCKLRPKKRGDDLRKTDALRTMTIEFKRIKP